MMVILFAGLQGIPRDYVEAAEVFGAGFFQRVRHVILPMLKPSIQVALLLRLIFAFEVVRRRDRDDRAGRHGARDRGLHAGRPTNENEHVAAAYSMVILGLSLAAAAVVLVVAAHAAGAEAPLTALRRFRIGRALAYVAAIAASRSFILAPIYLITLSAFSTDEAVYDYPKQLAAAGRLDGDDEVLPRLGRA